MTELASDSARRRYEKPVIVDRGDVRDVTLGGSPGPGDSGNELIEQPPGFDAPPPPPAPGG